MAVKMRYGSKPDQQEPFEFQNGLTSLGLTFASGVSLKNGGYAKIGKLVILNMRLAFSAFVASNAVVVSHLPKPANNGGLSDSTACVAVAAATSSTWAIRANGELYTRNDVTSGTNAVIMAVYVEE